jgi:hypothetical protein
MEILQVPLLIIREAIPQIFLSAGHIGRGGIFIVIKPNEHAPV